MNSAFLRRESDIRLTNLDAFYAGASPSVALIEAIDELATKHFGMTSREKAPADTQRAMHSK
jgi:hypothetical protein